MDNTIPTAKELLEINRHKKSTEETMIEFAKLHVKAALDSASKHVGLHEGTDFDLKAEYPLSNIK